MKISYALAVCFLSLLFIGCSDDGDSGAGIVNTDPNCSRIVNIPDANFKAKLVAGGYLTCVNLDGSTTIDANGDGEIQVCEAEKVGSLTIDQADINSIEGILEFRNIQTLSFKYNNISEALDLRSLKRLVNVYLTDNEIPSLNVTGLKRLENLFCDGNNLQSLSVKSLTALKTLYCQFNEITNLNIEGAVNLTVLRIYQNNISTLNVSHLSDLLQLYTSDNLLTNLDLSGLTLLQNVNCDSNNLQTLNATGCVSLSDLECGQNNLTQLNLSGCTNLSYLRCSTNNLTSLDFNGLPNLVIAACNGNQFVTIDIRNCVVMNSFDVSFNPNLQTLIVKNGSMAPQGISIYQCPSLTNICCDADEQQEIINDIQTYGYNCTVVTNCF
ncbi:hypothetical protein HKT18_04390 [Flavobacterium sp. IMCC34852]|uniref:Leucine-rich repeat domain-containing protein n=1 Tax=Flavobacterium rivulicola TaxID=2732161 RepID=A0A7Y3R8F8_9FLAO|nr:hypothetical protein [Flavobacterium sp. IMCC34852]NNT71451.1 hypothetical protein [Flavobacterium sp. IMCC34852]